MAQSATAYEYNVTFEAPKHTVGNAPTLGGSNGVSAITKGRPIISNEQRLDGSSLLFHALKSGEEVSFDNIPQQTSIEIEFDVMGDGLWVCPNYSPYFQIDCVNGGGIQAGTHRSSRAHYHVRFDKESGKITWTATYNDGQKWVTDTSSSLYAYTGVTKIRFGLAVMIGTYDDDPQQRAFFDNIKIRVPRPIVFIPGIAGSTLIGGQQTGSSTPNGNGYYLWPTISSSDIRALRMNGGGANDVQAVGLVSAYPVILGYPVFKFYGPYVENMQNLGYRVFDLAEDRRRMTTDFMLNQGYGTQQNPKPTFFPFPYDWRQDNEVHLDTLKDYIGRIKRLHGTEKIHVVAHSMGGVLLRRYVQKFGTQDFESIVTVGTPLLGSPKAIYRMLTGKFFDFAIDLHTIPAMKEALPSLPGAQELLPTASYFSEFARISPPFKENGWDCNGNQNSTEAYDLDSLRHLLSDTIGYDVYAANLDFHKRSRGDWAGITASGGILQIVGRTDLPLTMLTVEATEHPDPYAFANWQYSPTREFVEGTLGDGDGTVPLLSSLRSSSGTTTKVIRGSLGQAGHNEMMSNPEVWAAIVAFLGPPDTNGTTTSKPSTDITSIAAEAATPAEVATIEIVGTTDVRIIDDWNRENSKVGDIGRLKLPDWSIDYKQASVLIRGPALQQLIISAPGSSVPVDVRIDAYGRSKRYRIPPGSASWRLLFRSAPVLAVDTNGDGQFSYSESVAAAVDAPLDTQPPLINATVSNQGQRTLVSLTATDNVAVTGLYYQIDGGPRLDYRVPLDFISGQAHTVRAFALDAAQNTSRVVSVVLPVREGKAVNVSTRVYAQPGEGVPIAGFVITGGPKRVAVRATGPSLAAAGLPSLLADPTLELKRMPDGATVVVNDNWQDDVASAQALRTANLAPLSPLEAGFVRDLQPGAYTAIVRGKGTTSGICLVEVYDLTPEVGGKLINLSTRGRVGNGDSVMIGGFVVTEGASKRYLIRGIGPSLRAGGVQDSISDPKIEIYHGGIMIGSNDNWKDSQEAAIRQTGLMPGNDKEAAGIFTLAPGAYTAIVRDVSGVEGTGLVEVYALD